MPLLISPSHPLGVTLCLHQMLKKGSLKKANGAEPLQRSTSFHGDQLSRTPPSRRSTAESVASSPDSVSTPSSSGTWGPGRRSADGLAAAANAAMRLSGSVKMSSPPSYYATEEDKAEGAANSGHKEHDTEDKAATMEKKRTVAELRRSWDKSAGGGSAQRHSGAEDQADAEVEGLGAARPRRSSHGSSSNQ